MLNLDDINAAITEAGPLNDGIQQVARSDDGHWAIEFETDTIILECDAENERLMLSAEVGQVPEENREEIYKLLLSYGWLWRQTGGLRFACSPEDDEVTLMVDLSASQISPSMIALVAANLASRAQLWRDLLQSGHLPATQPPASEESIFPLIKV